MSTPAPNGPIRIAFLGAPGTGKSTLAGALVPQLKCMHLDVEFAREAARDYIRRTGVPKSPLEQFIMTMASVEREDDLAVHDYVVSDSASFVGDVYFRFERHVSKLTARDAKLDYAQEQIAAICQDRLHLFNHIFYVPPSDFGQIKDAGRVYTESQDVLDKLLRAYLEINLVDYHIVETVGVDKRVREVMEVLRKRGAFPRKAVALMDQPPAVVENPMAAGAADDPA